MTKTPHIEHVNSHLQIDHANHEVFRKADHNPQSRALIDPSKPKFRSFYESRLITENPSPIDATLNEADKESPKEIMAYVDFSSFTQRYKGLPLSGKSSRHGSKKSNKAP